MTPGSSNRFVASETLIGAIECSRTPNSSGSDLRVKALEREPFAYAETAPLEALTVYFDPDRTVSLVLKVLSPKAVLSVARGAKPDFVRDFVREIEVYRELLDPAIWGTAIVYGSQLPKRNEHGWILLERVGGAPLTEIGDFEAWVSAARWAARLHRHFAPDVDTLSARAPHLLRYDAAYYRRWMKRALAFTSNDDSPGRRALMHLGSRYDAVIAELEQLTATFIHGEFYAANILVDARHRVCPVDWETAGIGPAAFDLAALGAGWTDARRLGLAHAYRDVAAGESESPDIDSLLRSVDLCSLQIAIQWIGWSQRWSPPTAHGRDWLGDLPHFVEKLGL